MFNFFKPKKKPQSTELNKKEIEKGMLKKKLFIYVYNIFRNTIFL